MAAASSDAHIEYQPDMPTLLLRHDVVRLQLGISTAQLQQWAFGKICLAVLLHATVCLLP